MNGDRRGIRIVAVLLTAVCLGIVLPSAAGAQEVTLGVKGGINVSKLTVDDPSDPDFGFDSRTDFQVGVFAEFALGPKFAIQPEVYYSKNGADARSGDPDVKLGLDYIRVPVLLMARLSSRESLMYPILYAGPQVAFETACSVSGSTDAASVSVDCDDPSLDGGLRTKGTDFGLVFGGGFEMLFSRLTVQLDARYNLGLTNLNDTPDSGEVSARSRGWSFLAGFGVPIG